MNDLETHLERLLQLRQRTQAEIDRVARKLDEAAKAVPKRRRSRFDIPECGTESAYQRHKYRGEQADSACLSAHARHEKLRELVRLARKKAA